MVKGPKKVLRNLWTAPKTVGLIEPSLVEQNTDSNLSIDNCSDQRINLCENEYTTHSNSFLMNDSEQFLNTFENFRNLLRERLLD